MPFRAIGTEYLILRTLPALTSLNPIVLVVSDGRNLLRLWLRTKTRVLRLDLLHFLRIGLGLRPRRYLTLPLLRRSVSLSVSLGGCRYSRCSTRGLRCRSWGC